MSTNYMLHIVGQKIFDQGKTFALCCADYSLRFSEMNKLQTELEHVLTSNKLQTVDDLG